MVEVEDLYKKYGEFTAVDHLNLTVADGEVLGFVGPNGAGKTTTMKIMAGLVQADGGSVKISGIDALKESRMIKRIIGYMPDFLGSMIILKLWNIWNFTLQFMV